MKGCTSEYKRNWSRYNEHLVSRGELCLDLEWVRGWREELEGMNRGKRGKPFLFPDSMIRFVDTAMRVMGIPFRQMEGFLRGLSSMIGIRVPDYTTLWRRVTRRRVELTPSAIPGDEWVIAIDSTGIKVSDRGEWLRESWRVCRGWIKVHVAVEVSSKRVVGIEVSDEREADHVFLPSLVGQARTMFEGRIARVLADAAYDTHANFVFLRGEGIEAGIRIKRNASRKGRGSFARPLAVMERNRLGEAGWKERYGYGRRWSCESVFSAVKRIFGERVRSRRRENAFNEVRSMFSAYNRLLEVGGGIDEMGWN